MRRFCWCTVSVNDMDESLKFYQEIVGLMLNRRYKAGPGVEVAFLGNGETLVELISNTKEPAQIGQNISLGFIVKSVDDMIKFLKEKGVEIDGEVMQPNPHIKFFFVKDPNGLRIQFVEDIPR